MAFSWFFLCACKGQIALPNLQGFLRKSNVLNDGYKNVPGKLPEVNLAELAMTEFIGKGGLVTVQRTWWNGRELAAKVLRKLEHVLPGQSEEDREALAKEARVLLQAQKGCRRIVHVFAQSEVAMTSRVSFRNTWTHVEQTF